MKKCMLTALVVAFGLCSSSVLLAAVDVDGTNFVTVVNPLDREPATAPVQSIQQVQRPRHPEDSGSRLGQQLRRLGGV